MPSALSITWLFLVLPCTFAEPIGLELRASTGNIYLNAQIFTGIMYIVAALCLWFLRAWKIRAVEQLKAEKQANEQRTPEGGLRHDGSLRLSRGPSRGLSVKSNARSVKGLYAWKRV